MNNYNQTNRHERDDLIAFDAATHTYTIGRRTFRSVTTIVESCFEQFDADYWAQRKAPSLHMTPDEVKAMWARKGEAARNLGTQMHEKIERYYLGLPNQSDPTYDLFLRFARQHHLTPYRTEWAIFDEDSGVAGTLDFLNYADGVFTIYDWKRSNKIIIDGQTDKVSRFGKTAFAPISHIPATTFWHYALQVSIYRQILEKNYGISPSAGRLAVFHPDYGCPHVVEVPYLRDEAILAMQKGE